MKAYLRSARIAPKKANLIAMMVRGMRVDDALTALSRTHKKGARMVETLVNSAVANAVHNDKQPKGNLMIKTIVVNQGTAYRRGVPMARGRMRPMNKFLSHITLTLGIAEGVHAEKFEKKEAKKAAKKPANSKKVVTEKTSQSEKNTVKDTHFAEKKTHSHESSPSSDSSASSAS
jgi:large subunit ribosomal protein L22